MTYDYYINSKIILIKNQNTVILILKNKDLKKTIKQIRFYSTNTLTINKLSLTNILYNSNLINYLH